MGHRLIVAELNYTHCKMELVQRTFTYTHFQNVSTNLGTDNVNYVLQLKSLSGFTSYDETSFDYNGITSALYNKFPPNQFSTSPGGSLSAYTLVTIVNPHTINIGEYILLKPLFGDSSLLGMNTVDDIGDELGANPDYNLWIHKPYIGPTTGLAVVQINEVLAFFKGFDIQPTYDSINTYWDYIDSYINNSPDVDSFVNIGVSDYISTTPRRLFNELGFIILNSTGGTDNTVINLPIYLTQTIQNIGLYDLPYSSATDTSDITVLPMPNNYYLEYGITSNQPVAFPTPPNSFTYILTDGITANTYSDFYESSASIITGYTSDKSIKVRKYATEGIRHGYQLPSTPNSYTFTLFRNTIPNVNDGYIEYTTNGTLSGATRSLMKIASWGRSPINNISGNDARPFVSMVHEEFNDGLVLEPKLKNEVFIDRGVFSPFEKVYKLGYIKSLEDMVSFERGEFNVVQGTPLERIYLTNG